MYWILIFWIIGYSPTSVGFDSQAACANALKAIINENGGHTNMRGVCVPRGD